MDTLERETDRYEELINGMPEYLQNSPGETYADLFMEISGAVPGDTVLDAGCCSGKGGLALKGCGLDVTLMDITKVGVVPEAQVFPFRQSALWEPTEEMWDWVYCTDVMEHLPTEYVMLSLTQLLLRARKGVFFSISLQPDQFGMFIGQPLHLTVQPYAWWRDRLKELTTLTESRDFLNTGIYLTGGDDGRS